MFEGLKVRIELLSWIDLIKRKFRLFYEDVYNGQKWGEYTN